MVNSEHTVLVVVTHFGLLISAAEGEGLEGILSDLDALLVNRRVGVSVDGVFVHTNALGLVGLRDVYSGVVSRAVTLAIFTLDVIDGAAVRLAVSVYLDASVNVLVVYRSSKSIVRSQGRKASPCSVVSGATDTPGQGSEASPQLWPRCRQGLYRWDNSGKRRC